MIRHNARRKHKDLFTERVGGELPGVVLCRNEHHEAELVADWFRRLAESGENERGSEGDSEGGFAWKDMAVFYRNNALSRVMEEVLRSAGIPYVIARGTAFYHREEVKDALAYLRVIANAADDVSMRRIVNKPARKIGKAALEAVGVFAERAEIPLGAALRRSEEIGGLSSIAGGAIPRFVAMLDGWMEAGAFLGSEVSGSLSALVARVLGESGLEQYYKSQLQKSSSDADEQRLNNLEELISSAADFERSYDASTDPAMARGDDESTPPLLAMLRAYLESVSLVADADKVDPARGAVTLMTLHAAKGLEFSVVAMIGLEEGVLPGRRAMESDAELEEERRLCFVGITRAMRHILLTSAKYRTHRGLQERTIPSRFLSEMPRDGMTVSDQSDGFGDEASGWTGGGGHGGADHFEDGGGLGGAQGGGLTVGDRVCHPRFGAGRVESFSGFGAQRKATVVFSDAGRRTLLLQYASLDRA